VTGAADIAYGRRGGRWLAYHPGQLLAEIRAAVTRSRAEGWEPADLSRLFHPETIAATRVHERGCGGHAHGVGEACPACPDPEELAGIWAGRARMAAARRAAGQPLDDIDRQALARHNLGADPR
jgi:hypothetical protein